MGLIYLDTCLLIYTIENDTRRAPAVVAAMAGQEAAQFAVSPLVKMECLVKPMKQADLSLQKRYETGLSRFVQLPLPERVFLHAAQLRARFNLKTPDALHLACAQHHGCAALWTNDDRLAQSSHGLAVNVLKH
ncbi:MAG: type II toxin-antitoxin system VapC family toxin [Steroidobacteraceae bacterium]